MSGKGWFKVTLIVPGTERLTKDGSCRPQWWNDYVQAEDEDGAILAAQQKAKDAWEAPNFYEPGVSAPSDKEMGQECPVCAWAAAATDAEYEAWKKEMDTEVLPFV